jgi:energy-coupling factor transport system permease protein
LTEEGHRVKSISLYQPKDTFIHQGVDPFTKLIYFFCSMVAAFAVPTLWGAALMLLIHFVLLAWARELKRAFQFILGSLFLLVTIFVIQGLFNPDNRTLLFTIGPVRVYQEGLLFALTVSLRVVNIIAASCVLIMTTSPNRVMESCVRRGLSPKAGYVVTAIMQFIPAMMDSVARIREAQQSRGMSMEGNVFQRFRSFLPLLGPVVMSSLMTIQDKAMALEVRGFSVKGKKTFFHEEPELPGMAAVRILLVLLTALTVAWGVIA